MLVYIRICFCALLLSSVGGISSAAACTISSSLTRTERSIIREGRDLIREIKKESDRCSPRGAALLRDIQAVGLRLKAHHALYTMRCKRYNAKKLDTKEKALDKLAKLIPACEAHAAKQK